MSRSQWKLPFFHSKFFKIPNDSNVLLTSTRNSIIHPNLKSYLIGIHNGRRFKFIQVRFEMFNYKFGEFAPSRRMVPGLVMHVRKKKKKKK